MRDTKNARDILIGKIHAWRKSKKAAHENLSREARRGNRPEECEKVAEGLKTEAGMIGEIVDASHNALEEINNEIKEVEKCSQ